MLGLLSDMDCFSIFTVKSPKMMKSRILLVVPVLAFALLLILPSCDKDKTPPVITLTGPATLIHCNGSVYTDAGATAADDIDGDLTADIVVTNPLDANTNGAYIIRYNVSDKSGNAAEEVTRTVNVINCK
jgi:hypothetical protein